MLAIRVGKSVFFHFNHDLSAIFLQVGISACLLIGPALYFYLKSVIDFKNKTIKTWKYYFVLLFVGVLIFGIIYPWVEYPELWFDKILIIVYWVWFVCILASGYILKDVLKKIFNKNEKITGLDFWVLSVFFGNFIVWLAYKTSSYTSYITGALSFSFIFYLLFLLIHFKRKKISIFSDASIKYLDKKIDTTEANQLSKQLMHLMLSEKLYQDADLKLSDVAKKMNVIPHRLSQLLNDNLGKSFTNFINEYRIEASKILITSNNKLTLEAIGYECGYNSKSTFYTAFKKHTGTTPAKFKERI